MSKLIYFYLFRLAHLPTGSGRSIFDADVELEESTPRQKSHLLIRAMATDFLSLSSHQRRFQLTHQICGRFTRNHS